LFSYGTQECIRTRSRNVEGGAQAGRGEAAATSRVNGTGSPRAGASTIAVNSERNRSHAQQPCCVRVLSFSGSNEVTAVQRKIQYTPQRGRW